MDMEFHDFYDIVNDKWYAVLIKLMVFCWEYNMVDFFNHKKEIHLTWNPLV